MVGSITDALRKTFVWRGRATRGEFWWTYLLMIVLGGFGGAGVGAMVATALSFLMLPVVLSACVRRLHDLDRSAWTLLPGAVLAAAGLAGIGFVVSGPPDGGASLVVTAVGIGLVGWLVWLAIVLARKGDAGANAYGPVPGVALEDTR